MIINKEAGENVLRLFLLLQFEPFSNIVFLIFKIHKIIAPLANWNVKKIFNPL